MVHAWGPGGPTAEPEPKEEEEEAEEEEDSSNKPTSLTWEVENKSR